MLHVVDRLIDAVDRRQWLQNTVDQEGIDGLLHRQVALHLRFCRQLPRRVRLVVVELACHLHFFDHSHVLLADGAHRVLNVARVLRVGLLLVQ